MARARLLKPGFFTNEDLAEVGPLGQLLFAGLWTLADKAGRLDDRPRRIKAAVFPYYDADVPALLDGLEDGGFIHRYQIEDAHLIQIVKWKENQNPHRNEPESILPAPSAYLPLVIVDETTIVRTATDTLLLQEQDVDRRPAEAEANTEAEAEAEAESGDDPRPLVPQLGLGPYYLEFVKRTEKKTARPPSPAEKAAAREIEREFGTELCLTAAEDYEWEKGPAYLRQVLKDPRKREAITNGLNGPSPGSGVSAAPANSNGVADGVSGLDRRSVAVARLGRRG